MANIAPNPSSTQLEQLTEETEWASITWQVRWRRIPKVQERPLENPLNSSESFCKKDPHCDSAAEVKEVMLEVKLATFLLEKLSQEN